MKVTAVVLAGGKGRRMNQDIAKQYLHICGRPMLLYSLECFEKSAFIDDIVLVVADEEKEFCKDRILSQMPLTKLKAVVSGGKERYDSVMNALKVVEEPGYVFIHDGARPFVTDTIIKDMIDALEIYNACATGVKVIDTIKKTDTEGQIEETVDRSMLWQIQTPQAFDVRLIKDAYRKFIEAGKPFVTDDTMVVELFGDCKVKMVEGSYENMKVTTPVDMIVAEQIVNSFKG